jgi:nucleotide-binding universal stress UspA family protein
VHIVTSSSILFKELASNFFLYDNTADLTNARRQLVALRNQYRQHLCGKGKIEISILKGNPSTQLTDYIEQFEMDMVVMGLSRFNLFHRILSSVTISRLARKTAVLY